MNYNANDGLIQILIIMITQINKICQSVLYHLYNIRHIRKFLTYDNTKLLVQAVTMLHIDYCTGLLYGLPTVHLSKLHAACSKLYCTTNMESWDRKRLVVLCKLAFII